MGWVFSETNQHPWRWTHWENNHDGYGVPLWMVGNRTDIWQSQAQCYGIIWRGYLQGTWLTWEINSYHDHLDLQRCVNLRDGPDKCRDVERDTFYYKMGFSPRGWFKSTVDVEDPLAAAAFAAKHLGAVRVPSSYPDPTRSGCHYAEWVLFAPTASERPFWLHFVRSPSDSLASPAALVGLPAMCARGRNLSAGVFDRLLYNSIRFAADDLAPFAQRLRSSGVGFVVRGSSADGSSLFVPIPGSLFAIELWSPQRLGAAPESAEWDMCGHA